MVQAKNIQSTINSLLPNLYLNAIYAQKGDQTIRCGIHLALIAKCMSITHSFFIQSKIRSRDLVPI